MTLQPLGRLSRIDPRQIWLSEASDFTPWLARQENLAVLGEALGIDLLLEAQERSVGRFRADILCKDLGTDAWVLIENQLEVTDHTHLGQLLTYASGLEAVTIVWIAPRFIEEHRATLDWLNKITDESFRFFGLEIELWRIGDSPAAPKFNIVSKPNNWSRSVAQAARAIDSEQLSKTRLMQQSYWSALHLVLNKKAGAISGNRKAQPQSWMAYRIGRSDFNIETSMNRHKRQLRVSLYIKGETAKMLFKQLEKQRAEIETELGFSLEWEELPAAQDCRISCRLENVDPEADGDWPRQHEWLSARLNDLHRVFANRIRTLQPDSIG